MKCTKSNESACILKKKLSFLACFLMLLFYIWGEEGRDWIKGEKNVQGWTPIDLMAEASM